MAVSVKSLIEQTRERFRLQLLTHQSDLDFVVTWVHMLEDTNVTDFFWGNEMVVTSGYAAQDETSMLHFVDALLERHCTGLVINVGKYIHTIPQSVIDHCQENRLPLLTMPWEMSMTEFARACGTLISRSTLQEEDLAEAVLQIIRSPQDAIHSVQQLSEVFQEERGFQLLAIRTEAAHEQERISHQRTILRLHTSLRSFDFPYLAFRHNHRFILLLNQSDFERSNQVAERILELFQESFPNTSVEIGIGEPVDVYEQLSDSYHGAISAQRRASLQQQHIVRFRDMDFYKLLYSVPDDALLSSYYYEKLRPLLEHDKAHGSAFTETLFRYLLTDGSLQSVASAMYTHRNTVNYRMGRIRELLGCELDTQQERLPYLIAYHCGVILRLVEDMEE